MRDTEGLVVREDTQGRVSTRPESQRKCRRSREAIDERRNPGGSGSRVSEEDVTKSVKFLFASHC